MDSLDHCLKLVGIDVFVNGTGTVGLCSCSVRDIESERGIGMDH